MKRSLSFTTRICSTCRCFIAESTNEVVRQWKATCSVYALVLANLEALHPSSSQAIHGELTAKHPITSFQHKTSSLANQGILQCFPWTSNAWWLILVEIDDDVDVDTYGDDIRSSSQGQPAYNHTFSFIHGCVLPSLLTYQPHSSNPLTTSELSSKMATLSTPVSNCDRLVF